MRCRWCKRKIAQRGEAFRRWVHATGLMVCKDATDEMGRARFAEPAS